jgi:hypothetical protein
MTRDPGEPWARKRRTLPMSCLGAAGRGPLGLDRGEHHSHGALVGVAVDGPRITCVRRKRGIQGRNVLDYVTDACEATLQGRHAPSLLLA